MIDAAIVAAGCGGLVWCAASWWTRRRRDVDHHYPHCRCGRYLLTGVDVVIDRARTRHDPDRCQPRREAIP